MTPDQIKGEKEDESILRKKEDNARKASKKKQEIGNEGKFKSRT